MNTKTIWEPRTIYLYLVCLITLIMIIVSGTNAVRAVVELAYPEPELSVPSVEVLPAPGGETARPVQPETEEQRLVRRGWSLRNAMLNLSGNLAMLLLAGPIYLYHWRKVRQITRAEAAPSPQA
jgi:hypothetical protein